MTKIVIHGVHRSGTSLTASLLEKSGFWYAEEAYQMPAQIDNPKGFWERIDVTDLNDEILVEANLNWFTLIPKLSDEKLALLEIKFKNKIQEIVQRLEGHENWFLKDPRMSITWPLWKHYMEPSQHFVVHRHPQSVANSLLKRNGIPIEQGMIFWYHQTRMIAASLENEKNITNMVFDQSAKGILEEVKQFLKLESKIKFLDSDFENIFQSNLINHSDFDTKFDQKFPVISDAWTLAKAGKFTEIINLPQIHPSELSWDSVDSRYAFINHNKKLQEVFHRIEKEKQDAIRHKEDDIQRIENEKKDQEIKYLEDIDDLNQRLVEIAGVLKGYLESKRYMLFKVYDKFVNSLFRVEKLSLYKAFNIAIFGQKASALEAVFPSKSNRQLLFRAIISNPAAFMHRLSLRRVFKAAGMLVGRGESDIGVKQALLQYSSNDFLSDSSLDIFDPENNNQWIDEVIEFEENDHPSVSIVIPVYNNYLTTLACLHSIYKHTKNIDISYEVLIADDCSNDDTKLIEKSVTGLKVIRPDSNMGFLENCNNAIPFAKGKYIVLLNNDTNVQCNWLGELIKPLEEDSTIGVTGPMFLYPDGRLQEAGGIIFSDGSGWNYGRFDQPYKPEYNFARNVDYVSGACLVFKKSLWNKFKGFDKEFIPAYYEDTDFCFQAWGAGLKVRYIPSSKVVHFEGVSHGNNEDSGIKKFQVKNRKKFVEKWSKTLNENHYEGAKDLFSSRIHGKNKKTLLFIDHYVPFYDKDAGSKVAQRYIELLVEEGIHVIFMGDNFYPHQPYTKQLQALGVEVLYGEYYKNNWFDWLKTNSKSIDTIYLNRPHIAIKYINEIRSLKNCPYLVYHGADLHFVRVGREEKLGIKTDDDRSAADWKKLEFELMSKCDLSLWLSDLEVQKVKEIDSSIRVAYKPMYWFDKDELQKRAPITSCKNILFVGSFGHPPNLDGLKWFLNDIFPYVLNACPETVLTVIGSNCPDEVLNLQGPSVNVLGFVSEVELVEAYHQARVSIVPLRYGAGVKGKVIESMKYGVTVLTTDVGVEGLPGKPEKYLSVHNDPLDYSKALVNLLENDVVCEKKISDSDIVLDKYFSKSVALDAINLMFN